MLDVLLRKSITVILYCPTEGESCLFLRSGCGDGIAGRLSCKKRPEITIGVG